MRDFGPELIEKIAKRSFEDREDARGACGVWINQSEKRKDEWRRIVAGILGHFLETAQEMTNAPDLP